MSTAVEQDLKATLREVCSMLKAHLVMEEIYTDAHDRLDVAAEFATLKKAEELCNG